jgi:hypothetical protein
LGYGVLSHHDLVVPVVFAIDIGIWRSEYKATVVGKRREETRHEAGSSVSGWTSSGTSAIEQGYLRIMHLEEGRS